MQWGLLIERHTYSKTYFELKPNVNRPKFNNEITLLRKNNHIL